MTKYENLILSRDFKIDNQNKIKMSLTSKFIKPFTTFAQGNFFIHIQSYYFNTYNYTNLRVRREHKAQTIFVRLCYIVVVESLVLLFKLNLIIIIA